MGTKLALLIYLAGISDNLSGIVSGVIFVLLFATILSIISLFVNKSEHFIEEKSIKHILKIEMIIWVIFMILQVFIPSSETIYRMIIAKYGTDTITKVVNVETLNKMGILLNKKLDASILDTTKVINNLKGK